MKNLMPQIFGFIVGVYICTKNPWIGVAAAGTFVLFLDSIEIRRDL